jgi:hypothetical protein
MLNGRVFPPLLTDGEENASGMQFYFNAASGLNFSVWASTDLSIWTQIGSASEISRGWFFYQDSETTNFPNRFYQIRYP